ncbi:hypothetical protein C0431_13005 [bacterium]|nr:hypothetical protein [bacterium]
MKKQISPVTLRLIQASTREQVAQALNGLDYHEGIPALRAAMDITSDDIESFLEQGLDSLAMSKASLLSHLSKAEDVILEKHAQEAY